MSFGGYFLYPLIILLGLSCIDADCGYRVCKREAEAKDGSCDVYFREDHGVRVPSYTVTRTCGKDGPITLDDTNYIKLLAAYTREKTPSRPVHVKGAGAHGYFEVTHDITQYTKAVVFSQVGQKTPVFCRFSISSGEDGRPDTYRSRTGFACKFYTSDGNWDLVSLNQPVFFVKDPILYVSFIHIEGINPVTGRVDANMTWDFFTRRQESLNGVLINYSDAGTPYGYRHMEGYSINAFVFVNKRNERTVYVKFNWKPYLGVKNFTMAEGERVAGENVDWASKDLYDSIDAGDYPYWTLCIQTMTFEQAKHVSFDPLDATAIWFEHEFPCKPVGKMWLDRNPSSFFSETQQSGFSPANLIEGIDPSQDRLLQGRMFPYEDAQRYRIGINSHELPINKPQGVKCCPHSLSRDGLMNFENQDKEPNYFPNIWTTRHPDDTAGFRPYQTEGTVGRHSLGNQADYVQARAIYEHYSKRDQEHLAENIGNNIKDVKSTIQCAVIRMMKGVSEHLTANIAHHAHIREWQRC